MTRKAFDMEGSVAWLVPLLAWALAACSPEPEDPNDRPAAEPDEPASAPAAGSPAPDSAEGPAAPWSLEGLTDALRRHLPPPVALPDAWEPGVTDWEEVPVPDHLQEGRAAHDSPAELLLHHAAGPEDRAMGLGRDVWETTIRVLPHDGDPTRATGAILLWGYKDDALEGRDVRLHMERSGEEGDGGWFVTGKERRLHCRRGVTDDQLCV